MFLILRKEKSKCDDFSLQDLQEQFRRHRLRLQLKRKENGGKKAFSPKLCYFMSGKLNLNGSNALNAIVLHCSNFSKTAEET